MITLHDLLGLYCNWNGITKVNDYRLNTIVKARTLTVYEECKDLWDKHVASFDFIENEFIVRLEEETV